MPLRLDKEPSAIQPFLQEHLTSFVRGLPSAHYLTEAFARVRLFGPLATGSLRHHRKDGAADAWHKAGWMYLALAGSKPTGVVDIREDGRGNLRLASVRHAESAAELFRALKLAENVAAERKVSYTLRYLHFPDLRVSALWLAARRPLFVLVRESGVRMRKPRCVTKDEFFDILQDRGKLRRRRTREQRNLNLERNRNVAFKRPTELENETPTV